MNDLRLMFCFANVQKMDEPRSECLICGQNFPGEDKLAVHVQRIHANIKEHECTHCGLEFCSQEALTLHRVQVHEQFKCSLCNFAAGELGTLVKHYDANHASAKSSQPVSVGTSSIATVSTPIIDSSFRPYKCQYCRCAFESNAQLTRHINLIHNSIDGKLCSQCHSRPLQTTTSLPPPLQDPAQRLQKAPVSLDTYEQNTASQQPLQTTTSLPPQQESLVSCTIPEISQEHKCDSCSYQSSSVSGLARHITMKHRRTNWTMIITKLECDSCSFTAANREEIRLHVQNVHGHKVQVDTNQCDIGKETLSSSAIPSGRFRCDQCGSMQQNAQRLQEHVNSVHLKLRPLKCPHCAHTSAYQRNMKSHMQRQHGGGGSGPERVSHMQRRQLSGGSGGPKRVKKYFCDHCGKKYWSSQRLQEHVNGVHLRIRPLKCPQCTFSTAYRRNFNVHIRNDCGVKNKSAGRRLQEHVNAVHLNSEIAKTCVCDQCGKHQLNAQRLQEHINAIHLKIRPLKCPQCMYTSAYQKHLNVHIRMEHGQRPISDRRGALNHSCLMCGKVLMSAQYLQEHMNAAHYKIKPLTCQHCPSFATAYKKLLNFHLQSVHNIKAADDNDTFHRCLSCAKLFQSSRRLEEHVNGVHRNIKPHQCRFCNFATAYYKSLNKHITQVHNVHEKNSSIEIADITVQPESSSLVQL